LNSTLITQVPCVILAGGKSSRMGKDKSLLPFGDFDTLIEFQYYKLSQIFSNVYISSKTNKFNFNANLILDKNQDTSSPMIALQSILNNIKFNKVCIITIDTPLIEIETIKTLIQQSEDYEITVAKDNLKIHNLCGVFNIGLLPIVDSYIKNNNHKINSLLEKTKSKIVYFNDDEQFININTAYDYRQAKLKISNTNNSH